MQQYKTSAKALHMFCLTTQFHRSFGKSPQSSALCCTIMSACVNLYTVHTAPRQQGRGGKIFRTFQSKITQNFNKRNVLVSFQSRCDQWHFYMNTRIIDFPSWDQILLVKLKNVSFQNTDLTLYRLQFWTFSNVILHLEQGNVYSIKI